ncbi:hypothetical protein [Sutcliffiella horikoshii]|uniref:hypothetical protein n=1 Tax=Sutcliffiella horikoshii TaxID=79883 RepID=UPI001F482601|nr:hypothetical protein [Sutcliffiella horikoshii]MCG1023584.1 hypothetical protein [Sutcliffiella horikoshii]
MKKFLVKYHSIWLLLFAFSLLAAGTNPSEKEYLEMFDNSYKQTLSEGLEVEIKRVNFYLFSTYTPIIGSEPGVTHLEIYGSLFPISGGQFDYPW